MKESWREKKRMILVDNEYKTNFTISYSHCRVHRLLYRTRETLSQRERKKERERKERKGDSPNVCRFMDSHSFSYSPIQDGDKKGSSLTHPRSLGAIVVT